MNCDYCQQPIPDGEAIDLPAPLPENADSDDVAHLHEQCVEEFRNRA
jgi:hypothetical protein